MFRWIFLSILATASGPSSSWCEVLYTKTFDGDWVPIDADSWGKDKSWVEAIPKGVGVDYTVSHNDGGTGYGFDDPVYGPARLATVNAVLEYLFDVIEDDGRLDVEFNRSENDTEVPTLASAGTFYPSGAPSIQPGRAFTHITTGIDLSPQLPDIQVTVNFGYNYNSETDAPAGNEFDLYSIVLHEIVHGLGIASLIDSDGTSQITDSNPGVFTTFDERLVTGNGKVLMDAFGRFLGNALDITGRDGGVFFVGPASTEIFGSPPGVLAPFTWRPGGSLSHWASTNPNPSVMISGIGGGITRRVLLPYEVGALHDLGYQVSLPNLQTSSVVNWLIYE